MKFVRENIRTCKGISHKYNASNANKDYQPKSPVRIWFWAERNPGVLQAGDTKVFRCELEEKHCTRSAKTAAANEQNANTNPFNSHSKTRNNS